MIDHHPLGDGLVLLAMMLVLLLPGIPFVRKYIGRLGRVILSGLNEPGDVDREAEELSRVLRRQQLCADLRRVEHLIATDTWMSATRQRGNRLAYQQLLDDLRHTPDVFPAISGISEINSWTTSASTVQPAIPFTGYGTRSAPKIEILEIGWRR